MGNTKNIIIKEPDHSLNMMLMFFYEGPDRVNQLPHSFPETVPLQNSNLLNVLCFNEINFYSNKQSNVLQIFLRNWRPNPQKPLLYILECNLNLSAQITSKSNSNADAYFDFHNRAPSIQYIVLPTIAPSLAPISLNKHYLQFSPNVQAIWILWNWVLKLLRLSLQFWLW